MERPGSTSRWVLGLATATTMTDAATTTLLQQTA